MLGARVVSLTAESQEPFSYELLPKLLLAPADASCAIIGVGHARRGRYDRHRPWMLRSYILICSAVALRLISGTAGLIGVPSAEAAYVVAAWSCWLLPLAAFEIVEPLAKRRPRDRSSRTHTFAVRRAGAKLKTRAVY